MRDSAMAIRAMNLIGYDREADAARFKVSDTGIVVVPRKYKFDQS